MLDRKLPADLLSQAGDDTLVAISTHLKYKNPLRQNLLGRDPTLMIGSQDPIVLANRVGSSESHTTKPTSPLDSGEARREHRGRCLREVLLVELLSDKRSSHVPLFVLAT